MTAPGWWTTAGVPNVPITGWWAKLNAAFTLNVPPSLAAVPSGEVLTSAFDLAVTPALAFAGAGRSAAAFDLGVAPSLEFAAAGKSFASLGLNVAPSLAFTGSPTYPAAFDLNVPPSLADTGTPGYAAALDLAVPPTLAFTGVGKSTAAFDLSVPPSLADTGAGTSPAAFDLAVPPTLAFSGAGKSIAAFDLAVPPTLAAAGAGKSPAAFDLAVPPSLAFTGTGNNGATNVAYDATGAGGFADATSGTGTTVTWSHTIGANATAMIVGIVGYSSAGAGFSNYTKSVKVGSTALTLLGAVNANNVAADGWVELWGIVGSGLTALAGTAQTVTVNEYYTPTPSNFYPALVVNSVTYSGVGSFGTAVTNFGSSATASTGAVASASGDMVAAALCGDGGAFSAWSKTMRYNELPSASYNALLIEDAAGASSVTLTGTQPSGPWSAAGVNLVV